MRLRRAPWLCTLVLTALYLLLSGCSEQSYRRLSEDELRRLLPGFTILSATMDYEYTADSVRRAAYEQFFEREGYTLADWDSTMGWYASHRLELLLDIYKQSGDSLTRLQSLLQLRQDSVSKQEEYERMLRGGVLDSVNLLRLGVATYLPGELVNQSFALTPTTPYDSTSRVTLSIQGYGLPSDSLPPLRLDLRLYLSDSTMRQISAPVLRHGISSVSLVVPDGLHAWRLSGFVRGVLPDSLPGGYLLLDSLRLVRTPVDPDAPREDTSTPIEAPEEIAMDAETSL